MDWEIVNVKEINKKYRITLQLDYGYIKKLDSMCSVMGVKQYSKVIKLLIDFYTMENK